MTGRLKPLVCKQKLNSVYNDTKFVQVISEHIPLDQPGGVSMLLHFEEAIAYLRQNSFFFYFFFLRSYVLLLY